MANAKLYVMRDGAGLVKLGVSIDPERRRAQLGGSVELLHETDVLERAEKIELLAHRLLALHGAHVTGEWFEATIDDAIAAIDLAIKQFRGEELALGGAFKNRGRPTGQDYPVLMHIRVTKEMHDAVHEIAARTGKTVSEVVRQAIDEALVRWGH